MALQDLTPQLRTRLSRMERAVGWFVMIAVGLFVFGFGYYMYHTAQRRGWFKIKAPYFTFTATANGLHVGDPVQMMGFDVGRITRIDAQPPDDFYYNVYVEFQILEPYYGYLWTEGSRAKVATADLLGKRVLEVTKGTGGYPTYVFNPVQVVSPQQAQLLPGLTNWAMGEEILGADTTNLLAKPMQRLNPALLSRIAAAGVETFTVLDRRERRRNMTGVWHDKEGRYVPYTAQTKPYWLLSDESPAVTDRLEGILNQVEKAVPSILALTNQLASVLSNAASLTSNLNVVAANARPAVSNLAAATAQLNQPGALGEWLLPTNINQQLDRVLTNAGTAMATANSTFTTANTTLLSANTNLAAIADNLNRSLDNLANITGNLNEQVHANTNILGSISQVITNADQFLQGLRHHWLLRSAFRDQNKTNAPAPPQEILRSPKAESLHPTTK